MTEIKRVKVWRETYIPGWGNRKAGEVFELPAIVADELLARDGFEEEANALTPDPSPKGRGEKKQDKD